MAGAIWAACLPRSLSDPIDINRLSRVASCAHLFDQVRRFFDFTLQSFCRVALVLRGSPDHLLGEKKGTPHSTQIRQVSENASLFLFSKNSGKLKGGCIEIPATWNGSSEELQ